MPNIYFIIYKKESYRIVNFSLGKTISNLLKHYLFNFLELPRFYQFINTRFKLGRVISHYLFTIYAYFTNFNLLYMI